MDLIFDLPGVKKIVSSYHCDFGDTIGVPDGGPQMDLLTNVRAHKLPIYLTAIKLSGVNPANFGIADVAYGYNEDTGAHWELDSGTKGFFRNCSSEDLQKFHKAYEEVIKAHPTFKF